jgi:hypothetical protein
VLSNFEDASHGRKVWQLRRAIRNERASMTASAAVQRAHLTARFDANGAAALYGLEPLVYARAVDGLPPYVRSASALRRFAHRLVIVQDDVLAFAARDDAGVVEAVLLPPHASGRRVFDDTLGNKHEKLDLEACVVLPDGPFVAFGSGSTAAREQLVVWNGRTPPALLRASSFYAELRAAVTKGGAWLNVEGAVVRGRRLALLHRGNDSRGAGVNAIAELDRAAFAAWVAGAAASPRVERVTTVDLGDAGGVPYGFTDAAALDDERVVVVACAEDSPSAITDGAVLGCRVGVLDSAGLDMVAVRDAAGPTLLKLEGIERRPRSSTEFDVVVDVDSPAEPARLGRLDLRGH